MNGPYIRLLDLAAAWAHDAGMPPDMVLRRLCDWAVTGAFPPGAFINESGEEIDPLELFMTSRAVSDRGASEGVRLGGVITFSSRWDGRLLAEAILAREHVLAFCTHTNTMPPTTMLSGFKRAWTELVSQQHLAPPPCPGAEAHGARIRTQQSASAFMNGLEHILNTLQGKRPRRLRYGPPSDGPPSDGPINVEYWTERWQEMRNAVGDSVDRSGSPDHKERLRGLDDLWATVSSGFAERQDAAVATEASGPVPRLEIKRRQQLVTIDGASLTLPKLPFELLSLLAEKALLSNEFVPVREIEQHLWSDQLHKLSRPARDVVRDLRKALVSHEKSQPEFRNLIQQRPNHGYRLTLSGHLIRIDD